MTETTERTTPPVPPTDFDRYDDPELDARVLDRERQSAPCPQCGGALYLLDRQTGRRVLAFWPEEFASDGVKTSDDWPEVETVEQCERCGWHRVI